MNCDLTSLTYIKDCHPFLNWFLSNGFYFITLGIIFVYLILIFVIIKHRKVHWEKIQ
jgi:hypothetical protein